MYFPLKMDSTKRVLILGAKDCGKSALMAQLTKKIATSKTTKLNESYQESTLAAKFLGHTCRLHLLETENEGVHFMAKTSVIMVLFDSRSHTSQQESTRIFRNIRKISQVGTDNNLIIMVFTKCHDDSATKHSEIDSECHLLSTNSKTSLGMDELKLKMFRMAYHDLTKINSSQSQPFTKLTHRVSLAIRSTIKSMSTNETERESVVLPTIPFQLIRLPKERLSKRSSIFSLYDIYGQVGSYFDRPCSPRCPS